MRYVTPELPFPEPEPAERWLPVVRWEGLYEVSDLGRVRSLPRVTNGITCVGRILGGARHTRCQYRYIVLSHGKRRQPKNVYRMVLEAFVGPCPPGMEGLHGPGGSQDDRLVNLSWGTRAKNHGEDQCRDGTCKCGERARSAKLTHAQADEIKLRLAAGASHRGLAREYGMSRSAIRAIHRGKTWTHKP